MICGVPKIFVPTAETLLLLKLEIVLRDDEDEFANLDVLIVGLKLDEAEEACEDLAFSDFGSILGEPRTIELEGRMTGEDWADLWWFGFKRTLFFFEWLAEEELKMVEAEFRAMVSSLLSLWFPVILELKAAEGMTNPSFSEINPLPPAVGGGGRVNSPSKASKNEFPG